MTTVTVGKGADHYASAALSGHTIWAYIKKAIFVAFFFAAFTVIRDMEKFVTNIEKKTCTF